MSQVQYSSEAVTGLPPRAAPAVKKSYVDGDIVVRKANAKKLAAGYTRTKRTLECCYLTLATCLWGYQTFCTVRYLARSTDSSALVATVHTPLSVLLAMVLADFVSGVAHWGLDTWGTPDTVVFGTFIRSFREHHVDQTAMTKHDFIETNADTTLPIIPFLAVSQLFFFPITSSNVSGHTFFLTLCLFIGLTNQFHKLAHVAKPHWFVKALMDAGIILNPVAHRRHHKDQFDRSYCITTGWLNPLLDWVGFWRWAEAVVTKLTGEIPRANDAMMLGK